MGDVVKLPGSAECVSTRPPWQPPCWLPAIDGWPLPASTEVIIAALAEVNERLRPADDETIAVLLQPLAEVFGAPADEAGQHYLAALSDVPPHALATAVRRCIRELKFYPMPAEIIERADEFAELKDARTRLRLALWRKQFDARTGFFGKNVNKTWD
jgi:hypothetical protein